MAASTYASILYYGTQQAYADLATKDPKKLYFCTDTGKIYKGAIDFTNSVVVTATRPESPVAGKIYIITSTETVETYANSAWQVLNYKKVESTLDGQDNPVSTIGAASTDDEVASAKNVYLAIQEAIEEITGGGTVVKNVAAGTATNTIVVTKGDDSTSSFNVKGVVTEPTWNDSTRVLTLPVAGGTDVTVNIGKDLVLESGRYDAATQSIILVLNDPEQDEISIPVGDLIDTYVGSTDAGGIDVSVSTAASGASTISASLNLSSASGQGASFAADGLLVDLSNYALTSYVDAGVNAATAAAAAAQTTANSATSALEILNGGTGVSGSVDKKIADALASYVTTTDFNTTTSAIASTVSDNTANIAALAAATTDWGTF